MTETFDSEEFDDGDEYETNNVEIHYYPYSDYDIYYRVFIDAEFDSVGDVSFHHEKNSVQSRRLSKFEIKSILNSLSILQLPFIFQDTEELTVIAMCPRIQSTLKIKTSILKSEFTWDNQDQENYPTQLLTILVFTDLIESLIEINYDGLDMPMFE